MNFDSLADCQRNQTERGKKSATDASQLIQKVSCVKRKPNLNISRGQDHLIVLQGLTGEIVGHCSLLWCLFNTEREIKDGNILYIVHRYWKNISQQFGSPFGRASCLAIFSWRHIDNQCGNVLIWIQFNVISDRSVVRSTNIIPCINT